MNDWVTGPVTHMERYIDVFEGTVCVILRNGEAIDVRGPGRHGGIVRMFDEDRRLPVFGTITLLTFARAPSVSRAISTEVRLRDGATVTVTVQAAIVPAWRDKPETALEVVRRHGVQPTRIQEGATLELEESLRVMAIDSLRDLTHAEVHAQADPRTVMKIPKNSGILRISHLLSCIITRDPHEESAIQVNRDNVVEQLQARLAIGLDTIRRKAALTGQRETAVAETEIHAVVGNLLGISALDVAYPAQRDARLAARADAVRAVLEHNLDLVPLLADPAFARAANSLADLISGLHPEPSVPGPVAAPALRTPAFPATPLSRATSGSGAAPGAGVPLIRKSAMPSPFGQLEVLLVASGGDRVIGSIGGSGPHRLLIERVDNTVDIALNALEGAANWCGVHLGARVLNRAGFGEACQVIITGVEASDLPHTAVTAAVGAWIAAINALLAGSVVVSVAEAGS